MNRVLASAVLLAVCLAAAPAVSAVEPTIAQSLGRDPGLDYTTLTKFGPWDDRNYDLTRGDLKELPDNDRYVPGVPAFFKVLKRREAAAEGFPITEELYPRELDKEFESRFGGLMQNGVLTRRGLGIYTHPDPNNPPPPQVYADQVLPYAVPILGQGPLGLPSNNETAIEFSPTDPNKVIAGSNGSGGQRMHYSSDGGVTWLSAGALANTCCDPAMDWSPNGAVAYAVSLGGSGSFRTVFYKSTDFGATWQGPVQVSFAGSDKEYIHVDKSPTSPFIGNIYITWHQSNVMQFSRSTDGGTTFSTPTTFAGAETGIGSDITTDKQGNIYYFWPSLPSGSAEMWVSKSTDGGVTFGAPIQVYDLKGRFDFAIPSMESRRAFIYASADVDRSNGPRANRIYVAFTDETPNSAGNGGGAASATHGWVQVAYSDNGGTTWQVTTTPHATADELTVDRYHPWLDVDDNGAVHLAFYDTRNSPGRTGVDFYYVVSLDGGATWIEETRVSPIVSVNITNGQEWGDYNGLSASPASAVAMTWTDNRITPPAVTPEQNSFAARVTNIAAGPTYALGSPGTGNLAVCAGTAPPAIPLSLTAYSGFNSPVTLSTPGINAAVFPSAVFTPNPVTPTPAGAASSLALTTAAGAPAGTYPVTIRASNGGATPIVRDAVASIAVNAATPAPSALTAPADAAVAQLLRPVFTWAATPDANGYRIEVSTSNTFGTLVASATPTATTFTPATDLADDTEYFWRVRAENACGNGNYSPVRSFRTAPLPGACSAGATPVAVVNQTFDAGAAGWADAPSGVGTSTWTLSTSRPYGGTGSSWLAVDVATATDQWLVSPAVVLPAGQLPLSLQFQQDRTLEPRSAGGCWDGGFVEISTDNGTTWTQFTPAQVLQEPYTGALAAGAGNGRQAWCGTKAYALTILDLNSYAGQTAKFRFRVSTDTSVGNAPNGWFIDNVKVQSCNTGPADTLFLNGFE